jgi:hypothetical protein
MNAPSFEHERLRFDEELFYAVPDALCVVCVALGFGLPALALRGAYALWPRGHDHVAHAAAAVAMLLMGVAVGCLFLGVAGRRLVLGEEGLVIPDPRASLRWSYSDVAGYTMTPWRRNFARGLGLKGAFLTIRSRRPAVLPIEVFVFEAWPISPRMLRRLDEVVATNRHARTGA